MDSNSINHNDKLVNHNDQTINNIKQLKETGMKGYVLGCWKE